MCCAGGMAPGPPKGKRALPEAVVPGRLPKRATRASARPAGRSTKADKQKPGDDDKADDGADGEGTVVEGAHHVARLLHEAAAGPRALRAHEAPGQLLEGHALGGRVDVAAVGAHPLAGPVALLLADVGAPGHADRGGRHAAQGSGPHRGAEGRGGAQARDEQQHGGTGNHRDLSLAVGVSSGRRAACAYFFSGISLRTLSMAAWNRIRGEQGRTCKAPLFTPHVPS
mmetsp:Transcript_4964/g.16608  ORF Transcript_4964/g.16608 Transcript_4964/m.16608 type:complete len:227 (-) Transcript_4964:1304-1984(-)